MFLNREKELNLLKEQFANPSRSAILIYGKRRIGKYFLIAEAARSFDGIVINHLCAQTTLQGNIELLSKSICDGLNLPAIHFETLTDLFTFVSDLNRRILIILDEYSYMKESGRKNEVDSYMQAVIDRLSDHVKLILCGSYITVMTELLEQDNPLFGRFTEIIHLDAFDYYEAADFFPDLDIRSKITTYAVFGGSPYVLSLLNPKISVRENIIRLLLPPTGIIRIYIENVIQSEIRKAYDIRILQAIGNGKKRYSELNDFLSCTNNGLLDKQLKNLINMETIRKTFPINRPNDKKKQFYEISDNLFRFYFTYIFNRESQIYRLGEESFYESNIEPSLNQFVSRRFEQIVMQYFRRKSILRQLTDIRDYGTYWYDNPKTHQNDEFDCVLQRTEGYDFIECKYYTRPMTLDECRQEEEQLSLIEGIKCRKIGFACSAGFDFHTDRYELISGEDLFSETLR